LFVFKFIILNFLLIVSLKNTKGDSMLSYLLCLLLVCLAAGLVAYVAYEIYDIYQDIWGGC